MDWKALRATLRFDGAAWRRFAELGCVYGPEWWKRGSPPVIAAIIFAVAVRQRAAVRANQRQIREPMPGPRGWLREHWHAYRVFAEFARSVTEAMEQWGPQPRPLELHVVGTEIFEAALAEHRGLVALTGHFGSWEVAARHLAGLGRPSCPCSPSAPASAATRSGSSAASHRIRRPRAWRRSRPRCAPTSGWCARYPRSGSCSRTCGARRQRAAAMRPRRFRQPPRCAAARGR